MSNLLDYEQKFLDSQFKYEEIQNTSKFFNDNFYDGSSYSDSIKESFEDDIRNSDLQANYDFSEMIKNRSLSNSFNDYDFDIKDEDIPF